MTEGPGQDGQDAMDALLDELKSRPYRGGFNRDTWEEEFDKIPMFMKKPPSEIDPTQHPDLACLQSMIFDDERPPEEQAKMYKDEGNDYFKDKDYQKASTSYSEGLKKSCDPDLRAVLFTNRAAAQFHLGNLRSALSDVSAARKLRPNHLKAIIRGALCHLELKNFAEAVSWCQEGLKLDSTEKKLLEVRTKADRLQRAGQRDARKAKLKEQKARVQREALLRAIQERDIKLLPLAAGEKEDDEEEEDEGGSLGVGPIPGATVSLGEDDRLTWPVLFLYPEHGQTDFISAFHEDSRFIDHLAVMFAGEPPPWDLEQKYQPSHLELYFEDDQRGEIYQLDVGSSLLQALQHPRYQVKAATPAFLVLVRRSPFCQNYLRGKKVHQPA
uniref:Tetratricopeptide repeat domain 4 n=1 Tax=Ornithorhynchus anatinus TaxID=9258 RepID=F7DTS6_ORNAN